MKRYWWILMLLISYIVYMGIMFGGELLFPLCSASAFSSCSRILSFAASFFGIFLVVWFFRGYFKKK